MNNRVTLNDSTVIPQLGLGVWKMRGEEAIRAVRSAIDAGYRHIDTAAIYQNEEEVGRAIADAIAAGDITREELFVTTKLWNNQQHEPKEAFAQSLQRLGLDYVDLYLVHWPYPKKGLSTAAFEAIAEIQGLGTIQSIGVSNYYPEALDKLIQATGITPSVNQIELHPGFSQAEQRADNARRGIATESWSPLGQGEVLSHPVLQEIAQECGRSVAQVALRWNVQLGNIVIPKSSNPERIAHNAEIFEFELSAAQMERITALDTPDGRVGPDPRNYPED